MTGDGSRLPSWLHRLQNAVTPVDRPGAVTAAAGARGSGRPASVLVLFGEDAEGPDLLFIERAASLRSHPGQVAFPGGGVEAGDRDLVHTALRETAEETGVEPAGVRVFGLLQTVEVAVSGFRVTPVLGWWHRPGPVDVVDPGEVAAVRRITVSALTDPDNRYQMLHPSGRVGPGFLIDDLLIWGVTGHLLDGVLSLGGWQRPWNRNRTMEVPPRYLGRHAADGDIDGDIDAALEGEIE